MYQPFAALQSTTSPTSGASGGVKIILVVVDGVCLRQKRMHWYNLDAISQACTKVTQSLTSRTAGVGAHRECVRSPHVAISKIQG